MESVYYSFNPWWEDRDFQFGLIRSEYTDRLPTLLQRKQIEIIIGSRRVGKTTLLKQFIHKLIETGMAMNDIFYLPLDHPALSNIPISEHLKQMRKIFMHDLDRKLFLFLDEVHESPNWDAELKSLYDLENLKIFCTGSTSSLIESQNSKLTGRQIITTLFPLSFREFILFRGKEPSIAEDYKYERLIDEYLSVGGYPENVLNPSPEYMSNLLDDILVRDLMRIHPIKKGFIMKDLLRLVTASVGSRTSFNKLSKVLGISVDTVKEYLGYLEAAFLVIPMEKWTTSYSEKTYAQKKIYLWDHGIKTLFTGAGDLGYKAENTVFIELKRKKISCGYYAESEREVDFVTGNIANPFPLEVKYISSFDWTEGSWEKDKRLSGVKLFLRRNKNTSKMLIISRSTETEIIKNSIEMIVVPLWKFLLTSDLYIQR